MWFIYQVKAKANIHTFEFVAPAIDGFRRIGLFGSVLVNRPEMSQDLHKSVEVHRFLPEINMIIYDFKTQWLVVYDFGY